MNQRVRVTLLTVVVTTLLSLGIGGFAVQDARHASLHEVDDDLALIATMARDNSQDVLNAALFAVDSSKIDASLIFLSAGGDVAVLSESSIKEFQLPNPEQIAQSVQTPVSVHLTEPYRLRTIQMAEDDLLLIAISISDLESTWHKNFMRLLYFLFVANLLAISLSALILRYNSRRLEKDSLRRMQIFLGDAAHELRTPLTVIKGYAELLATKQFEGPQEKSRALDRVNTEVARMESLINDLLLTAELSESTRLDFAQCDLSELAQTHLSDFQVLAPERSVVSAIQSGITITASIDHLERLLQNIFTNIRRHTPVDAPVRISLSKKSKEALLVIEDGGPGLPEEAYAKPIQEFERFDRSRSRDSGGSGLGMSIMAAIVKEHKGTLTLGKSDLGGLRLTINLPAK